MTSQPVNDAILGEQIAYYRARAAEYDEWWLRQGRYHRTEEENASWFAEVAIAQQLVDDKLPSASEILEFAGGTGIWTQRLSAKAHSLHVVDAAPEMIAINRLREHGCEVTFENANLFEWAPQRKYDAVFFSFWLSHVPPHEFAGFWQTVSDALNPDGIAVFVDSQKATSSTAIDHILPTDDQDAPNEITLERRLNNQETFTIYKLFYEPAQLAESLHSLGWKASVELTGKYFLVGSARRSR